MKLIIEIPEDVLKEMKTKEFISIESLNNAIECIKNGTPLDDVKAEIDKAYDSLPRYYPFALNTFAIIVDEILDRIGKESEDT